MCIRDSAEFVKAFEARFNRKPSYLAADAYLAFMLVHEAITKAKSTDVAAVRGALKGLKLAKGPDGVRLQVESHGKGYDVVVDQLLVAVGRAPNVEGLGLETVGEHVASALAQVTCERARVGSEHGEHQVDPARIFATLARLVADRIDELEVAQHAEQRQANQLRIADEVLDGRVDALVEAAYEGLV